MTGFLIARAPKAFRLVVLLGLWGASLVVSAAWAETEAPAVELPGSIDFVAENLFSTARGTFHEWRVIERSIDPAALEESRATVEVTLRSVDTGIERRDEHLLTAEFFDVETHPVAIVRAHSLVAAGESEEGHPRFTAQFDVDLHGVQKTLEGQLEIIPGTPIIAHGSLVLDRVDFGIGAKPSRWNPMSIDPTIPIEFRVEF